MRPNSRRQQFDLERWLRLTINGRTTAHLEYPDRIIDDKLSVVGKFGGGGAILGKSGTDGIVRWALYPGISFETVTHHLLKQTLIARIMLGIEEDHENPNGLRFDKILSCALTHDLSETVVTDVNYHEKNKSASSRAHHKRKDRIAHDKVVDGLRPEWRAYFPAPPDVNEEYPEVEKLFWQSAELVGYCLFMLEELRIDCLSDEHKVKFFSDVERYIGRLEAVSTTFSSVREMLDMEIMPKWHRLVKKLRYKKSKAS